MTSIRSLVLVIVIVVAAAFALQAPNPAANFDVQKLADNVYAVIRKDPPGLMVDANNVFIVKDDFVIVVDANGAPAITREVLAALRRLTTKPVRYVVNTHYHDDHIRGNQVYRDAFPGVEFVAHEFAREYLPAQGAANRKAFLEGAPPFADQLRGQLRDGKSLLGGTMSSEERESLSNDVALADFVLRDGAAAETVLPTIAIKDRFTVPGAGPRVEILHLGNGHTAADLVIHLPSEGIVITGDLVVWPIPLVGDPQSWIGAWSNTLDAIRALKPSTIVPGHGPVLHDDRYLATLSAMFASIRRQAGEAVARGETLEQARKTITFDPFRDQLVGESPVRKLLFANYVARPAVGAAFREASSK
jgi:glyoxylase-like metal-dependent hydrolase (beta-lactamase superfamily II)